MAEPTRNEVVLRYRDGHLTDGEQIQVNISDLKAVFFLKEPRRREAELQFGSTETEPPAGAPARVEFFDGEIIHGLVQEYRMEDSGFFLFPTSPESNNEMVFVVARAINTLSLEG